MARRSRRAVREGEGIGDGTSVGACVEGGVADLGDRSTGDLARLEVERHSRAAGEGLAATPPSIALGVTRSTGKGQCAIAVRVQARGLENSPAVETIRARAMGEVDVRYIGVPTERAESPWYQRESRPLRIGASIGHHQIKAGTLGGFVRARGQTGGPVLLLSNNHVFDPQNNTSPGAPILQPGVYDLGIDPTHKVGTFVRSIKLKREGFNLVNAAVAEVDPGIDCDFRTLTGPRKLAGPGDPILADGETVQKIGRTTGTTSGRITAFELDGIVVSYPLGLLRFNSQFESEGVEAEPFDAGGDSGSMIFDADRRAVGLLFAGSDQGGANGKGLTYANPFHAVLDALQVDLFLG